jgi:hypothetical protein
MKTSLCCIIGLAAILGLGCRATTADDDWTDDGGNPSDGDADAEAEAEADAEVPCPCPVLPTACTAPAAGQPTFTPPNEDAVAQLFDLLACATTSLHIAMYETDWDCIVNALLAKLDADTDITLEMVIDDDRCPRGTDGLLTCPLAAVEAHDRVTIRLDERSGLMHHKFVVADDSRLWVASANFTRWSFCTDWNNALVIDQPEIVAGYGAVFSRMFVDGRFGPQTPADPVVGGAYSVTFSPESPITSPARWFTDMVAAIGTATTTADVLISAWTRTEISDALVAAAGRGVTVRAVVDDMYVGDAPALALIAAGIPVRAGSAHSKQLILDGNLVVTGSPNWSENAWSNNENSLWIRDAGVATAYEADFERVWALAHVPTP